MAKKVYSVDDYLTLLRLAKRSEVTIKSYRKVIKTYADFIGVPLDEVHKHLSVPSLLKYAESRSNLSGAGMKTNLTVLRRYFKINGIKFGELEYNATAPKVTKEHNDKPLDPETIRAMMDMTNTHGKAFLSFLISTGCRADEACNVLMADVHGDCVVIRNEIAKNKIGGRVYLTAEAQQYIEAWLKERDAYIRLVDKRAIGLAKLGALRPKLDNRLFGMSYASAHKMFSRLYDAVDGVRGKYHRQCTIHSCRKYFRTHAAQTMHPDLVTNLMRQSGYLDNIYVRVPDDEKRKQFHAGEHSLYITRPAYRMEEGEIKTLRLEKDALAQKVEEQQAQLDKAMGILTMLQDKFERGEVIIKQDKIAAGVQ